MSTLFVETVEVGDIVPHPNADKLEIAKIKGTQVVCQKGCFAKGQTAIYFPPDMLIPEAQADALGVKKYLKHAVFEGGVKTQCRVAATRLRGQPSYGFLIPTTNGFQVGDDASEHYGAKKYEPPVRYRPSDQAPPHPYFHEYTSIQHYWRYPDAIPHLCPLRITEKIHGTNSRVGLIRTLVDEFAFMAGSHHCNLKRPEEGRPNLYWEPLEDEAVLNLLTELCAEEHNVILFGEVFGPHVQDLDYGIPAGKNGYRVFDISIDGRYLDWSDVRRHCSQFGVFTVPLLYEGPFAKEIVQELTDGQTWVVSDPDEVNSAFRGREGIVITPAEERHSEELGGRLILKSVSADYLDRRGAEDNG